MPFPQRCITSIAVIGSLVLSTSSNGAVQALATRSAAKTDNNTKKDPSVSPDILVWDNVLSPGVCSTLHQTSSRLGLGHRVFSRRGTESAHNSNVVEQVLDSILKELGDDSEHVEYWTRQEWRSIHAHADVDEYLAKRKSAEEADFRYPHMGHVLYLQVGEKVRGPTCVFPHRRSGGELLRPISKESEDTSIELVTVPAVEGRLLRFQGDYLHAVPRPTDLWLLSFVQGSPDFSPEEEWGRSVVLFNTWGSNPPLEVPIDEKLDDGVDSGEASCNNLDTWSSVFAKQRKVETTSSQEEEDKVNAKIWLLGDLRRRDHQMQTVKLSAPKSIRTALFEESHVSCLTLGIDSQ
ncbi:MAG: hypothetical protein SGILL_005546 [Bacillariaceae sp.]